MRLQSRNPNRLKEEKLTAQRRVCYSMRPIYSQREELWRTKKRTNARTRSVRVHLSQTASIAARHAKAPARLWNLIAIVDIRSVPETSNFSELAQCHF